MLSFDLSTPWRDMSLVSVDVETTGLDVSTSRVIEVGVVRFERGQIADRWGTLVDPQIPIPAKVTEITGITDEMVRGKPTLRELKWSIYGRLRDRIFVAYNSAYDWGILSNEFKRVGLSLPQVPVLDPLVWARQFMPSERSHRLGAVCKKLGIPLENAHRAEDDAEAAARVLLRLADKVPMELGALLEEQAGWTSAQEAAFAQRRAERAARKAAAAGPGAPPAPAPAASPVPEEDKPQTGLFA